MNLRFAFPEPAPAAVRTAIRDPDEPLRTIPRRRANAQLPDQCAPRRLDPFQAAPPLGSGPRLAPSGLPRAVGSPSLTAPAGVLSGSGAASARLQDCCPVFRSGTSFGGRLRSFESSFGSGATPPHPERVRLVSRPSRSGDAPSALATPVPLWRRPVPLWRRPVPLWRRPVWVSGRVPSRSGAARPGSESGGFRCRALRFRSRFRVPLPRPGIRVPVPRSVARNWYSDPVPSFAAGPWDSGPGLASRSALSGRHNVTFNRLLTVRGNIAPTGMVPE
jgi:hypothetical protein